MDDRHPQFPRFRRKSVDWLNDLPPPRRRAGALRISGEMSLVHIDRYHRGIFRIKILRRYVRRNLFFYAVKICEHGFPPLRHSSFPWSDPCFIRLAASKLRCFQGLLSELYRVNLFQSIIKNSFYVLLYRCLIQSFFVCVKNRRKIQRLNFFLALACVPYYNTGRIKV